MFFLLPIEHVYALGKDIQLLVQSSDHRIFPLCLPPKGENVAMTIIMGQQWQGQYKSE